MNSTRLPALRIVVLAAGFSVRLGETKALTRVQGRSLLRRTIGVLAPFAAPLPLIVVVPPRSSRFRLGLQASAVAFVANPRRSAGMSSSVRLGVARARHSAGVLLLPVDLIDLERRDIERLIARWRGARRRVAARRLPGQWAGSPLILPRCLYGRAAALDGEYGLRDVVRGLPRERIALVDMPSAERDIDLPQDLEAARRRRRRGR